MPMRVDGLIQTIGPPPPLAGEEPKEPGPELDAWRMRMKAVDDWRNSALDHGFDPQTILAAQGITGEHGGGGWSWMNNLKAEAQYGKGYNSMYQYDWVNGKKRLIKPRTSEDYSTSDPYRDWEAISPQERDSKARADYLRANTDQADFERLMYNINPGGDASILGMDAAGDFGGGSGSWVDPGRAYFSQWTPDAINPWTIPLDQLYNTKITNVTPGSGGGGGGGGGSSTLMGNMGPYVNDWTPNGGVIQGPNGQQIPFDGNYSALTGGGDSGPSGTSYAKNLGYKDPKAQNTNVAGYSPYNTTPYGGGVGGQNSLYGQEYNGNGGGGGGYTPSVSSTQRTQTQQVRQPGQQYASPLNYRDPKDPRNQKINPLTGQPMVGY